MKYKPGLNYYELHLSIKINNDVVSKMENLVASIPKKPQYGFCEVFHKDNDVKWLTIILIFCEKYPKQTTEYCNAIFRKLLFHKIIGIYVGRLQNPLINRDILRFSELKLSDLGVDDVIELFKEKCNEPV